MEASEPEATDRAAADRADRAADADAPDAPDAANAAGESDPGLEPTEPGRIDALRARVAPALEQGKDRLEAMRRRKPGVELVVRITHRFQAINGSFLAGYLAYRLFLLLLPLVVIIVALSGFSADATRDATQQLKLGEALASSISTAGAETHEGRVALLITGLVGFAFTAWGLLSALQFVSAQAWGIPTRRFPGKAKRFLRLAGSLLLFGVIIYISALVRRAGVLAGFAGTTATAISATVAYAGMAWILPRRSKEWFWILPGAAAGGVGQLVLQVIATYYLPERLAGASHTYGAFGITVTMLFYLYLLGLLLVLVPAVNAVVWELYEDDPPGILRRVADRIPISTTGFGSGYVAEGESIETIAPFGGGGESSG